MSRSLVWLAKLEVTERRVLGLLREAWIASGQERPENREVGEKTILAALVQELRANASAIDIREPQAELASIDEIWLLGALALAQRSRMRRKIDSPFTYQAALDVCGTQLLALGVTLPFTAVGRHLPAVCGTQARARNQDLKSPTATGQRTNLALASPRVRALCLLQSQETVSAKQFVANGVPYKLLGELCKRGVMRRQARGMYVRSP